MHVHAQPITQPLIVLGGGGICNSQNIWTKKILRLCKTFLVVLQNDITPPSFWTFFNEGTRVYKGILTCLIFTPRILESFFCIFRTNAWKRLNAVQMLKVTVSWYNFPDHETPLTMEPTSPNSVHEDILTLLNSQQIQPMEPHYKVTFDEGRCIWEWSDDQMPTPPLSPSAFGWNFFSRSAVKCLWD